MARLRTGENARIARKAARQKAETLAFLRKRCAIEDAAYSLGKTQTNEASPMAMIREVNAAWDAQPSQARRYCDASLWKQYYLEGRLGLAPGLLDQHEMYKLFKWSQL